MLNLTHLYGSNQRYWYDLPPNRRRTVKTAQRKSLTTMSNWKLNDGLRPCVNAASSKPFTPVCLRLTPDEPTARLVVLGSAHTHKVGVVDSKAIGAAKDILENRGSTPRNSRNMLAFVAPDKDVVPGLELEVRRYLAWKSIVTDAKVLNLDTPAKSGA